MVHFQLARAATPTRFLITLFLLFLLIGQAVATIYAYEKTGLRLHGTRIRYQGAREDEATEEFHFPISREELLRLTHVHAYGMAMMFYLFGHVLVLTQVRPGTKMFLLGLYGIALLGFLAAPWLVKHLSAAYGCLYLGSLGGLDALAVIYVAIPIREMWFLPAVNGGPMNGSS